MKRLALIASTSLALLLGAYVQPAHAVPTTMSFTGKLQDSSGLVTGAVQVVVKIYNAEAVGTGTEVWTETHTVTADAGLVFIELGNTTALDEGVFDGSDLWLDITVNGDQQTPRIPFNAVPYATRAAVADSADTLGTLGPTDVALVGHDHAGTYAPASHNHAGTYLPVGATLSCGGTQKVTGLNSNGSVVCGADVDTNTQNTYTAGTGLSLGGGGAFSVNFGNGANDAARGNHAHAGVYLPVGASLTCGGTQKVTGLNANGSVICGNDVDTNTNTTYSAGTGLDLSSTTFSVDPTDFNVAPVHVWATSGPLVDAAAGTGDLVRSASIVAPTSGYVVAMATAHPRCNLSGTNTSVDFYTSIQTTNSGAVNANASSTHSGWTYQLIYWNGTGSNYNHTSIHASFPVAAGTRTFYYRAGVSSGDTCNFWRARLTLMFIPG